MNQRTLKISFCAVAGSIDRYYAFVNGTRRVAASGDKDRSWEGKVDDGPLAVMVKVTGRGDPTFSVTLTLSPPLGIPGKVTTEKRTVTLLDGYCEVEIAL